MSEVERFSYTQRDPQYGHSSSAPVAPITLTRSSRSVTVQGLLDTGASVNVLPFTAGQQLGAMWEQQSKNIRLTGNLAAVEARGLIVQGVIGGLAGITLAFAWVKTDAVPVLLGEINFFQEFDVCFYRASGYFEIRLKQSLPQSSQTSVGSA